MSQYHSQFELSSSPLLNSSSASSTHQQTSLLLPINDALPAPNLLIKNFRDDSLSPEDLFSRSLADSQGIYSSQRSLASSSQTLVSFVAFYMIYSHILSNSTPPNTHTKTPLHAKGPYTIKMAHLSSLLRSVNFLHFRQQIYTSLLLELLQRLPWYSPTSRYSWGSSERRIHAPS